MEMNGIAHIELSVRDYPACRAFYRRLFEKLEMNLMFDSDERIYGVGSRTGILVAATFDAVNRVFQDEEFHTREDAG